MHTNFTRLHPGNSNIERLTVYVLVTFSQKLPTLLATCNKKYSQWLCEEPKQKTDVDVDTIDAYVQKNDVDDIYIYLYVVKTHVDVNNLALRCK